MGHQFSVAPWTTGLKIVSFVGSLALLFGGVLAYRAIPDPGGFTHWFGLCISLSLPAVLVGCLFFVVTGYTVEGTDLYVNRLVTRTRIPLEGIGKAWHGGTVCKGSLRVFGNGGLFSFTGIYRNAALGTYRLYATDFSKAVVLQLPDRVVVITPASPEGFLEFMHHFFPSTQAKPASPAAHS